MSIREKLARAAPRLAWVPSEIEIEEPDAASIIRQLELSWHDAWRHEARGPHGEWVKGPQRTYSLPDPARLHNDRSPFKEPGDHPFFQAHPVSPANIAAVFDESSEAEREQGMKWYADAHNLAVKLGGGDTTKAAGVMAAYSPQTAWPVNMLNAARALAENRALGKKDGMITGSMQANAQKALDGQPLDKVLKSPKINAFGHLIAAGGDHPDDPLGKVVIDRHALSVATGQRMTAEDMDTAPIKSDRYYQHVADAYRQAAAAISKREGITISPHQLQAITWLRQQDLNENEDQAAGAVDKTLNRLQRGRETNRRNSWARWTGYDWEHNLPSEIGTTSLPGNAIAPEVQKSPEGFSISMGSGQGPKTGFMVAQTDHTHVFPDSVMADERKLADAIDQMLLAESGTFSHESVYLGGWVHDGKLWLEPSDNVHDRADAEALARQRNQIAIWDVSAGDEIQTGGTGGGQIYEHASACTDPEGDPGGPAWLRGPPRGGAEGRGSPAGTPAPGGLAAQLYDLAFNPAEPRGPHGEWLSEGGGGHGLPVAHGDEARGWKGRFVGQDRFTPDLQPAKGHEALTGKGRVGGTGTAEDPIDVQGNLGKAITLMAAGKHVRLNQVDEIATLISKINETASQFKDGKAPKWDLGMISVRGTNLFTEQTKGIPRIAMPQLNGPAQPGTKAAKLAGGAGKFIELDKEFRAQLRAQHIDVKDELVPASHLRATQTELTATTVAGIAAAAQAGNPKVLAMLKEPLWISRDNYVVDGHHRWAALMVLDAMNGRLGDTTPMETHRIDMDIGALVPYADKFAQDWGISARALGNTKLVEHSITAQAIELGWQDAWLHELRAPDGRWVRGASASSLTSRLQSFAKTGSLAPHIPEVENREAVKAFADKGAPVVPELLGGGRESWNGHVALFPDEDNPGVAAEMRWTGRMDVAESVAAKLQQATAGTGPIADPQPFAVILHELIHGVIGDRPARSRSGRVLHGPGGSPLPALYSANQEAYQNPAEAAIEEGFTELGTVHHAAEFFDQTGIGDRELSIMGFGPASGGYGKPFTLAEYAGKIDRPDHVEEWDAWGHYPWQTAAAQSWAIELAKTEGLEQPIDGEPGQPAYDRWYARVRELSDEINREGTAEKVNVMARQVMRAENNGRLPAIDTHSNVWNEMTSQIISDWPKEPGQNSGGTVVQGALRKARIARLEAERMAMERA